MRHESALPVIRPISDLRTNLNNVCDQARETQEPLIFTKNGSPALVVMDSDAYERQQQRDRIYLALREAEIEEKFTQAYSSYDEVKKGLEEKIANWESHYV